MPHNAPNDRLSRLINSVCQVWEEEAAETESKLVTLANRIIADNEHEKMRMQHSFKSMMNMKNNEIGALSQELRKLNFALEQEAKENMENKRKVHVLTMELEALRNGNGNGTSTSPLSSCSHLIEDDVSSLHSSSSTGGGGGSAVGAGGGPPGVLRSTSAAEDREHDLSVHGNYPPRHYDNQQQHSAQPQGLFTPRSPSLHSQPPRQIQHQSHHQHLGFHQSRPQHQHQGGYSSGQQVDHAKRDPGAAKVGGGGGVDGLFKSQSAHSDHYFAPGQHLSPSDREDQWSGSLYGHGDDTHFNLTSNGSKTRLNGKAHSWEPIDYQASVISILDDRDDDVPAGMLNGADVSSLSLSDGPPGFSVSDTPPGFLQDGNDKPPGFGHSSSDTADKATDHQRDNERQVDDGGGSGGEGDNGSESTEKMLNHIRLQSKSSKLDASPVNKR